MIVCCTVLQMSLQLLVLTHLGHNKITDDKLNICTVVIIKIESDDI